MRDEIEISTLDLRYESYRMKNPVLVSRLLATIVERGIEEPLEGVERGEGRILLNGFKRYRCARKLGIGLVPYLSLGGDEATGILTLMRVSNPPCVRIVAAWFEALFSSGSRAELLKKKAHLARPRCVDEHLAAFGLFGALQRRSC